MVVLHPDKVLSRGEDSGDLTRKESRPMARPRWLTPRKPSGNEKRQAHWQEPKGAASKEVADLVGAVHQVSCLAEEGVHAGGNDDGLNLALLAG